MLKRSLFTYAIMTASISIVSSLQCMEITTSITGSQESYWQNKRKYILCAHLDKTTQRYSACRYWDADCITPKEDGQRIFHLLKARYATQEKAQKNRANNEDSAETID